MLLLLVLLKVHVFCAVLGNQGISAMVSKHAQGGNEHCEVPSNVPLIRADWKLKCPTFQNAQRYIAQGNILPKDFMPNMTICPRRHFAQRFFAQIDNLPKKDKLPKMTFCP